MPRRLPRKHIVFDSRADSRGLHSHLDSFAVGLASPQDRVDRFEEFTHSLTSLGPRPIEPRDVTIRPRDVTVRARRDVHDDLPALLHAASPPRTLADPTSAAANRHVLGFLGRKSYLRKREALLSLSLRELASGAAPSLQQILADVGGRVKEQGLTAEMLDSLLEGA
jgi:hypothetical protein